MASTYDKDPYTVLGIPRDADAATIKKAYRRLALQHHPDRRKDPDERGAAASLFADIAGAYEILTDERMRREWDRAAAEKQNASQSSKTGRKSREDTGKSKLPKFKFNPSDPYEVWKKDFEDQFGRPYPGADADVVTLDTHIYQKRQGPATVTRIDKRKGSMGSSTARNADEPTTKTRTEKKDGRVAEGKYGSGRNDDVEKKTGCLSWLLCKKYRGTSQDASSQYREKTKTSASKNAAKHQAKETALVTSGNTKRVPAKEKALAVRNNQRSIVERETEPAGHDNRPISMEVTVEEGADGSTITTTTMTRPDGTVEKCIQRTGIPGRAPFKPMPLEMEKAKLALEGDKTLMLEGPRTRQLAIANRK